MHDLQHLWSIEGEKVRLSGSARASRYAERLKALSPRSHWEQCGVKALPLDQSGFSLLASQFRWRQNEEVRVDRGLVDRVMMVQSKNSTDQISARCKCSNLGTSRGRHPYRTNPADLDRFSLAGVLEVPSRRSLTRGLIECPRSVRCILPCHSSRY